MICRATGGECRLADRAGVYGNPNYAQCIDCSQVYEATWSPRVCAHCGLGYGDSLHDPCLGYLEGVGSACCGHGVEARRYTSYLDGTHEGTVPA
jgi:hypothetical protein